MTILVDELQVWPHAKHRCFRAGSAHLTFVEPSTVDDLHAFAAKLGLRRAWFQPRSTPHYDLSPAKHGLALRLGATFLSAREQAKNRIAKRQLEGGHCLAALYRNGEVIATTQVTIQAPAQTRAQAPARTPDAGDT